MKSKNSRFLAIYLRF